MKVNKSETPASQRADTAAENPPSRRPYTPPHLARLGDWRALTLQQSIPIGPGSW